MLPKTRIAEPRARKRSMYTAMNIPPFSWYPSTALAPSTACSQSSSLVPATRSSLSPLATRPPLENLQKKPRTNQARKLPKEIVWKM